MHDCMKTFYKGINVNGIHLLDLQLLQDKNWMKSKQFSKKKEKLRYIAFFKKKEKLRYIAIQISYCDTI